MSGTVDWNARIDALTERLNPIIVKEIRQGLRTRIFWICFGLMLLACFILSLVAYGTTLDRSMSDAGQAFFFAYFLCLSLVHFFIIPYSAYRSLAREREEETWVLLSLTGIGARRVIRGKLGSFLVQAMLYGSAVLPFLLFSYYLNGIDLPTILTVVALGGAFLVFLTCVAVCAATLADSRLARGLVHFLLLGTLLLATFMGLSAAAALTFDGTRIMREKEFLIGIIASLWAMVSFGNLLFQTAAARLALPTEDYARGPRLALGVQMLGSAGLLAWAWVEEGRDTAITMIAQLLMVGVTCAAGIFMLSGMDPVHEVHFRRRGFPLFRPGTLPAFRFILLLVGATTALWMTLYGLSSDRPTHAEPGFVFIVACAAYGLLYLSLPIVIARLSGARFLQTAVGLRTLAMGLLIAGSGVPPLAGLVVGMKPDDVHLNLFNPLVGLVNFGERHVLDGYRAGPGMLVVLVAAAVLMAFFADQLLSGRERVGRRARSDASTRDGAAATTGS